jgi:hypothetical protein
VAHPARRTLSNNSGSNRRTGSVGAPSKISRICVSDGTAFTWKIVSRLQRRFFCFMTR